MRFLNQFSAWDYIVLVFALLISAAVGLYYALTGGKQKTTEEIFLGDRKMKALPVAASLLASFMSAVTLLGLAAENYTYGWEYWQICLSFILVIFAANYLYLPVFYHFQMTSTFEYFERRYNKHVRVAGSLTFIIQMVLYLAIVLYAPSLALNAVTGFSITASLLSIGIVCTFYTTVGGMKAVIWTDVIQCFFMFAGIFAIIGIGTAKVGGFDEVWRRAVKGGRIYWFNYNPNPFIRHTFWTIIVGGFFMWLSIFGVNQTQVQRCLSCPTLRVAKNAMLYNLPGLILLMTVCSLSGLVVYALYYKCDPYSAKYITSSDQLLPYAVMDLMNYPGIPGLFVASLFSGSLSTMSAGLNSLAAVVMEDIIKTYRSKPLEYGAWWSKVLAALFGLLIVALSFLTALMGPILQAALTIFGMIGGPLLGLFTLAMFIPWSNTIGGLCGWFTALFISFWIGTGAIMYKIPDAKAPVTIEGCQSIFNSTTTSMPTPQSLLSHLRPIYAKAAVPGSLLIYRLSYLHLSLLAVIIVLVVGMITSYLTGFQDIDALDPYLITKPMRKFYLYLGYKYKINAFTKHEKFFAKGLGESDESESSSKEDSIKHVEGVS